MKYAIKNRFSDEIIHECKMPDDVFKHFRIREVLIDAVKSGANLYGANLYGADLSGAHLYGADLSEATLSEANLYGANLSRANLSGANLSWANLSRVNLSRANLSKANLSRADLSGATLYGANLSGANLSGANLSWADLSWADLSGAKLEDLTLLGDRPFFQMGPIGSRSDQLYSFITDSGVFVRAGCFFGSLDDFCIKVAESHGDTRHGQEYQAAITLIDMHAKLWTPSNNEKGES